MKISLKLLLQILLLLIMNISVIQPDTVWEDKNQNFENISRLVNTLFNQTDLVILPEMFNTGFSMNPEKLCEPPDGETFKSVSYTHLRAHETVLDLVCRLL